MLHEECLLVESSVTSGTTVYTSFLVFVVFACSSTFGTFLAQDTELFRVQLHPPLFCVIDV